MMAIIHLIDEKTGVVQLPYARAAEVMLHFNYFYENRSRGLRVLGNPHWKEINESYLPPHPSHNAAVAMPRQEYIEAVLAKGNKALADTPYMFVCVQDELSGRAEASKFLADHFSLRLPGPTIVRKGLRFTICLLLASTHLRLELANQKRASIIFF